MFGAQTVDVKGGDVDGMRFRREGVVTKADRRAG